MFCSCDNAYSIVKINVDMDNIGNRFYLIKYIILEQCSAYKFVIQLTGKLKETYYLFKQRVN